MAPRPTRNLLTFRLWLLLARQSTAAGRDGDLLTNTTLIQRINTTGGLAPAPAECNKGTVNTRKEVQYSADYLFLKKTVSPAPDVPGSANTHRTLDQLLSWSTG